MLYNQFPSRGVIRAGATGAWAPIKIGNRCQAPVLRNHFSLRNCRFRENHEKWVNYLTFSLCGHPSCSNPNDALCLILLRNVQKLQLAPFCSSQLFLALVSSFLALVSSFLALVSSCNLQLALVISSQLLLCSQMKVQTKRESFLNNAFTYAASSQLCYQQV